MFIRLGSINLYGVVNGLVECFEIQSIFYYSSWGKKNPTNNGLKPYLKCVFVGPIEVTVFMYRLPYFYL